MGRPVSYPSGAIAAFPLIDEPEDELDQVYECLVDDVVDTARVLFSSLEPFDGRRGRQDRILLRNAFADCSVSPQQRRLAALHSPPGNCSSFQ